METMGAVIVTGIGQVEVVDDVPVPEPGDYEALARIRACGFCNGTDFHIINGSHELNPKIKGQRAILGHEAAGEIVKVGKKVRHIKIGDRFINPFPPKNPGNGYTTIWGGMSQYGLINDKQAREEDGAEPGQYEKQGPFPSDMDFVDAGVLLSLAECHSAVINFGLKPGHDVLIYGAGPMGIALGLFCKLLGAGSVTQIDSVADRLERAKTIGNVDRVIDFSYGPVDDALKGQLFDLVIDAVGSSKILIEASWRLKQRGTVGSLGVLKQSDRMVDAGAMQNNTSLHMLNNPWAEYDVMPETVNFIQAGKVNPKDFYSHVLPYTEVHKAMELIKSKEALKVILTF